VTITARVTGATGAGVAGQSVQLSATAGSLSNSLPTTGSDGVATVTLATSSTATVFASSSGINASVNVEIVGPFTVKVEPKYSVVSANQDNDTIVTVTQSTEFPNAPAPSTVVLTCGNGQTHTFKGSDHASCNYRERGTYEVVAAATGGGFTATARSTVTVETPQAPSMSLGYRVKGGGGSVGVEVEVFVNGAPDKAVCTWDLYTAKPSGGCRVSINYDEDEANDDGDVPVSVDVDVKDGSPVTHLETTMHLF